MADKRSQNYKRTRLTVVKLILLFVISLLVVLTVNSRSSYRTVDMDILNQEFLKYLEGENQEMLIENVKHITKSEGVFSGHVRSKMSSYNVLEITVQNNFSADDSLGDVENKFYATVMEDDKWHVYLFMTRHACQSGRYPSLWQNIVSSFISPLWSNSPCT